MIQMKRFQVGAFQCNCTVLWCADTKKAIVIDPGDEADLILNCLREEGLQLESIIHTHAHLDHVGGVNRLQEETNARLYLHKEDLFLYENVPLQASFFGMKMDAPRTLDGYLSDGDELKAGRVTGECLHTPGHTPGSLAFRFPSPEADVLFTGDTLFAGSIGRTDLWGGDFEAIMTSIKTRFLTLDDDTLVRPGHGPDTTIGREKKSNPFLKNIL